MTTIKRILVPTDFSENARTAYEYAIDLAEKYKASIDVVHIYTPVDDGIPMIAPDRVSSIGLKAQLTEFVTHSIEDDDDEGYISLRKVKVNAELKFGGVSDTIIDLSKKDYDLVVIGSVGEGSFAEIVFGSVTTKVAQDAFCPVLVVPKNSRFHDIKKLLYACDFKHKSFKHPALISEVAMLFKSKIDLVYVKNKDSKNEQYTQDLSDMKTVFITQAPHVKVETHVVEEDDVFYGINQFAEEHKTDMVVLITKHYSFLEKAFRSSVTKEMAMYTKLPLWIIKATD
jgi:nucleotide-binding universal stress UspA family protein